MPYIDPVKKKEYDKKYNANLSLEQLEKKKQTTANWWKSPRGKYKAQMKQAIARNILWDFTFDTWLKVWTDSGYFDERGRGGYCMCRKGDEGPYSSENVYIALMSDNKRDAWFNNKVSTPTGIYYKETI